MNKFWLGVVILVVILAGGWALLKGSSKTKTTTSTAIQPTETKQVQVSPITQSQNTVTLTSSGFEPNIINVKAGSKVVWINKSGESATVNSDPHPVHTDYLKLNLGEFSDGQTLELVFDKAGTYKYHNHLNPSEKGQIVVQ